MTSNTDRMSVIYPWWRLSNIKGLGVISQNQLFELCSAQQFSTLYYQGNRQSLAELGFKDKVLDALFSADTDLDYGWQSLQQWCQLNLCGVLFRGDDGYPESLAALRDAPLFLFYAGDIAIINDPAMAIVGSRNPSHYGREQATNLSRQLVAADWNVISGLAIGIDGAAHQGGLRDISGLGNGHTIAVLGSGLNNIYPKRHVQLAHDIVNHGGLLLSEHLPDDPALARNFPRRNRIVSGLSKGVLVIEAALKSGSLITARLAADQGREVFAIPGPVTNPLSRGCHLLIKEGASLVECVEDILLPFGHELPPQPAPAPHAGDGISVGLDSDDLLSALDTVPVPLDVLVARTGKEVAWLSQQLMFWELKGKVSQVPGGYIRIA